jgi:hypothetical protein
MGAELALAVSAEAVELSWPIARYPATLWRCPALGFGVEAFALPVDGVTVAVSAEDGCAAGVG